MCLTFLLLLIFLTNVHLQPMLSTGVNNYGPYELNLTDYSLCPGVKLRPQAVSYILDDVHERNVAITNLTLTSSLRLESIRIIMYRGNDKTNVLYKYLVKNPCQHPVIMPALSLSFNTDRHCVIKEGQYSTRINFNVMTKSFIGNNFFYGEFTSKSILSTKSDYILCVISTTKFIKKD